MPSASGSSVFLHHWEPNLSSILWAKMYIVRWPLHLWEGHRCYLASRTFAQRTPLPIMNTPPYLPLPLAIHSKLEIYGRRAN